MLDFLPRCTLKTIPNVRCPHSYFIIMFSSTDLESVDDEFSSNLKSLTQLTHVLMNIVLDL